MIKKTGSTRLAALIIAALTLLSLTACIGKGPADEKVKLTNVYKSQHMPLSSSVNGIERMASFGGKIYFYGYGYKEETQQHFNALYVMNEDGTDAKELFTFEDRSDYEKQIYNSFYLMSMAVDSTGNLWYSENESYSDYTDQSNPIYRNTINLKKISSDGTLLLELNVSEATKNLEGLEYFYVDNIVFDQSGNPIIYASNYVIALDKDTGAIMYSLQEPNWINGLVCSSKKKIYISTWDDNGPVLKEVDPIKKAWGETIKLNNSNYYNLMPGSGEYDFFYQTEIAIYGFKIDNQESVEVLNWINSDINNNQIGNLLPMADGTILGTQYLEDTGKYELIKLTRKPDDEIVETTIITYATVYLDYDVRSSIINFNRNNEDCRIQVIDYSQYRTNDNWMAGHEQLNLDIVSGKVPDIISLDSLQINNYINKGLLADLYPLIDNDPELSREDFVPSVLEAASQEGKLYRLFPSFNIFTIAGKSSIVGDTPGWTIDELNSLLKTLPEETQVFAYMTKSNILSYSTMLSVDQFIDFDTGKCSFDSDGFIKLLEFANSFKEAIDWSSMGEDYWMLMQNAYKEERILLMDIYYYNIRAIRDYKEQFDAPITFKGFPAANKNGSVIVPQTEMAISAKSKNQEAAWQFLRSFVTEDHYSSRNYYGALPVNKNVLEAQLANEMLPLRERPENQVGGGIVYRSGSVTVATSSAVTMDIDPEKEEYEESEYEKMYPLTQEEVDQVWSLINSANTLMFNDSKISEIIEEEAEYYFSGNKTAADTAAIIQNRIQTYISESR